jgi:hypothetical protein
MLRIEAEREDGGHRRAEAGVLPGAAAGAANGAEASSCIPALARNVIGHPAEPGELISDEGRHEN